MPSAWQSVWQNWFTSVVRLHNFERFMARLPPTRKTPEGKPIGVGLHGAPDEATLWTVLPKMRVAAITGSTTGAYIARADGCLVFEFAAPALGLLSLASWIGSKPRDAATFRFRIERTQRRANPIPQHRTHEPSPAELKAKLQEAALRERALTQAVPETDQLRARRQLQVKGHPGPRRTRQHDGSCCDIARRSGRHLLGLPPCPAAQARAFGGGAHSGRGGGGRARAGPAAPAGCRWVGRPVWRRQQQGWFLLHRFAVHLGQEPPARFGPAARSFPSKTVYVHLPLQPF